MQFAAGTEDPTRHRHNRQRAWAYKPKTDMMRKEQAVAALGKQSLLLPARIKAALAANDRLKLYLSLLQAALQHGRDPQEPDMDWRGEVHRAGLDDQVWLVDLPRSADLEDDILMLQEPERFVDALVEGIEVMARPVEGDDPGLSERLTKWVSRLQGMRGGDGFRLADIEDITHGDRHRGDSFHILVMDLHKRLNALAASVATENIDGAHAWQIGADDRALIEAFMRGLRRTAPLKFEHPGLDTAVTRDGDRLLIQNDIGTNDAHVLVVEVTGREIRLTYSELHKARFAFFREMLERIGFQWVTEPLRAEAGLNEGRPYLVGHATLRAQSQSALLGALEALASRIVFVIDWNRAYKRLQLFVRKAVAADLLREAAEREYGHMGWLLAGGEQLVFGAMQSADGQTFRVGDRLDEVIGEASGRAFLAALLQVSSETLQHQQTRQTVVDQARILLNRALQQRSFEFDLLAEHAAACHALAELLVNGLDAGTGSSAATLAEHARLLEHRADWLLEEARERAGRQGRWEPVAHLLSLADDIADALEEAAFVLSMIESERRHTLPDPVRGALEQLALATLAAIQDYVRVVEIARAAGDQRDSGDASAFLRVVWQMLRAERRCDELFRQARVVFLHEMESTPVLWSLAGEVAASLEKATDALLAVGHGLREMVFARSAQS